MKYIKIYEDYINDIYSYDYNIEAVNKLTNELLNFGLTFSKNKFLYDKECIYFKGEYREDDYGYTYLYLDVIKIQPEQRNKGKATNFLNKLLAILKQNNVNIEMGAIPLDKKGLDKVQLIAWYKKLGFKFYGNDTGYIIKIDYNNINENIKFEDWLFYDIMNFIQSLVDDIVIKDVAIIGTRVLGTAKKRSDLDILVSYDGFLNGSIVSDIFNHEVDENDFKIDNYDIDFIETKQPIDDWLKEDKRYNNITVPRIPFHVLKEYNS